MNSECDDSKPIDLLEDTTLPVNSPLDDCKSTLNKSSLTFFGNFSSSSLFFNTY